MRKDLYILWTNSNINTSLHMVLMYAANSKIRGWWENVTVIIWGDTARLVSESFEIQERVISAMQVGVKFSACKACAENLGKAEDLEKLGIEAITWGTRLTNVLKSEDTLITV